jgi:hypothetical protein
VKQYEQQEIESTGNKCAESKSKLPLQFFQILPDKNKALDGYF